MRIYVIEFPVSAGQPIHVPTMTPRLSHHAYAYASQQPELKDWQVCRGQKRDRVIQSLHMQLGII